MRLAVAAPVLCLLPIASALHFQRLALHMPTQTMGIPATLSRTSARGVDSEMCGATPPVPMFSIYICSDNCTMREYTIRVLMMVAVERCHRQHAGEEHVRPERSSSKARFPNADIAHARESRRELCLGLAPQYIFTCRKCTYKQAASEHLKDSPTFLASYLHGATCTWIRYLDISVDSESELL